MPELPDDRAAWEHALAELEAELAASADAAVKRGRWSESTGLGPLPVELAERARNLLAAQRETIGELERQQRTTSSHLAALRAVPSAKYADQSVYLDVSG